MKKDIRLKYTCDQTWKIEAMSHPTIIPEDELQYLVVDN
jgi:hypothetical protein